MNKLINLILFEVSYYYTKEFYLLGSVSFFIIIICLFPICIGPSLNILKLISFAIIWISMLLTSLLTINNWLDRDYINGTIELQLFSSLSLEKILLARIFSHWIINGIPLVMSSPILFIFFNFEYDYWFNITGVMLMSSLKMSLLGVFISTLTLSLNQKGIIVSVIMIPIYIPIFIFTMNLLNNLVSNLDITIPLMYNLSFLIFLLIISPWLSAQLMYRNL